MNQILDTGEEIVTKKVKKQKNVNKQKNVLPINGIVAFYAISIIILGICMISGSVYAYEKINETVDASKRPEIIVERNDDDNTLQITVTHEVRGIKAIEYRWNDEEETIINGQNKTSISEIIDLIGGENTLTIIATDENGQTTKLEKMYKVGNIPQIELEAVSNGVKIIASSEQKIDYVQYSWDDGEMEKVEVGEKEYEGIINAPTGKHTLKIEVVDINRMKGTKEQVVVGDTEPTVNVESKLVDGKPTFVIDAEDDENIKTITIIHNGGEQQVINVNAKTYHEEIVMTDGETNTLIITAINQNNLSKTRRIKFDNK